MNVVDDVLSIILSYVGVENVLVCKHWMDVILKSSFVCKGCNKITHSYGKTLWFTHAIYNLPCHAVYDHSWLTSKYDRIARYYQNLLTIRQCRGICLDAVTVHWGNLKYIKKPYRTNEIFETAINNYVDAIKYIDEHELTPALVKFTVLKDGMTLGYISKKYQTHDIIHTVLKNCGLALQYVKVSITLNMCYTAIRSNGLALRYVPTEFQDKCTMKALKSNGKALKYISPYAITEQICIRALASSISAAQYVPIQYQYLFKRYTFNNNYGKYRYLKKNNYILSDD